MSMVYVYQNEKGRKTYLHEKPDGTFCAMVGKLGGDYRQWKSLGAAEKALENKGWKKIGERRKGE